MTQGIGKTPQNFRPQPIQGQQASQAGGISQNVPQAALRKFSNAQKVFYTRGSFHASPQQRFPGSQKAARQGQNHLSKPAEAQRGKESSYLEAKLRNEINQKLSSKQADKLGISKQPAHRPATQTDSYRKDVKQFTDTIAKQSQDHLKGLKNQKNSAELTKLSHAFLKYNQSIIDRIEEISKRPQPDLNLIQDLKERVQTNADQHSKILGHARRTNSNHPGLKEAFYNSINQLNFIKRKY